MNICPNCFESELTDGVCPKCGFEIGAIEPVPHALPPGTVLDNRYMVGKVLGQGGFGITYLGYDDRLEGKVAIKEYYPANYAGRQMGDTTYTVHPFGNEQADFFKRGLGRFQAEAKRLLKFAKSPGFADVRDIFSEKGTAYYVMEFVDGEPLSSVLPKMGGKISEKATLDLFLPVIRTLGDMHKAGIIHRDIAPDNIMVQRDGEAVLIDLGSSIEIAEGTDNKSTVALVKSGYGAEELYDTDHTRQGTWSDVYSISASMYRTLTGNTPPDAYKRLRGEALPEITEPVSETVKKAIYKGLELFSNNRTQTMEELYNELTAKEAAVPNSENLRASVEKPQTDKARDLPAGAAPPEPPQIENPRASIEKPPTPVNATPLQAGACEFADKRIEKLEAPEPHFSTKAAEKLFFESGDFMVDKMIQSAKDAIDSALKIEPFNPFLWWRKLLIRFKAKNAAYLGGIDIAGTIEYKKAFLYGKQDARNYFTAVADLASRARIRAEEKVAAPIFKD
jgi:serine/threonine protein kinase